MQHDAKQAARPPQTNGCTAAAAADGILPQGSCTGSLEPATETFGEGGGHASGTRRAREKSSSREKEGRTRAEPRTGHSNPKPCRRLDFRNAATTRQETSSTLPSVAAFGRRSTSSVITRPVTLRHRRAGDVSLGSELLGNPRQVPEPVMMTTYRTIDEAGDGRAHSSVPEGAEGGRQHASPEVNPSLAGSTARHRRFALLVTRTSEPRSRPPLTAANNAPQRSRRSDSYPARYVSRGVCGVSSCGTHFAPCYLGARGYVYRWPYPATSARQSILGRGILLSLAVASTRRETPSLTGAKPARKYDRKRERRSRYSRRRIHRRGSIRRATRNRNGKSGSSRTVGREGCR